MELISLYLCSRIPIETNSINSITFDELTNNGWYKDAKSNRKFTMMCKRILVDGQWYRVLVRFEYVGINFDKFIYTLSLPCPFIITKCEPLDTDLSKWKDTKSYHGLKLTVPGYLQEGIPVIVIDEIYQDLKESVEYI